ncbi:hypothetical protein DPMN_193111 [Dreissena polymorpha]|uniref:Uncharacterized protein n=1 Tax=Dreissena polymorpha TaxID=45954 RepID=A0A9D3Y638_DREPO|nr:hypothetical protein DPMN_193111 [Dreissena polymorpha]
MEPDAQKDSIFTGNGVSSLNMLTSIGLYLDRRDLSLSFIEPSMYESNTKSSLLAVQLKTDIYLANAAHMSLNALNPEILNFLMLAITSTMYAVGVSFHDAGDASLSTGTSVFFHFMHQHIFGRFCHQAFFIK